jgi:hypothetical protein
LGIGTAVFLFGVTLLIFVFKKTKGVLSQIIIFVMLAGFLFLTFFLSGSKSPRERNYFFISTMKREFGTWHENVTDGSKTYAALQGSVRLTLCASNSSLGEKVKKVTLKNFTISKRPSAGTPLILKADMVAKTTADRQALLMPQSLDIAILDKKPTDSAQSLKSNYFAKKDGRGQIEIQYGVFDLGEIDTSGGDTISQVLPTILNKGYTNDSLRSTISFDIEITTKNGKVYTENIIAEMIEHDFLQDKELHIGINTVRT